MGRNPSCSKEGLNRGAWTAEEDEILASYVRSHGEGKWRSLTKRAGLNRCGKSCRLRWLNYLRPGIKRGNISEQEEDLIIRLHKLLGNRWSLIAGRLPGRTDNEIKNYWNTTLWKKAHGRPLRAPKRKRTTEGHQKTTSVEILLSEATTAPQPTAPQPKTAAEDTSQAVVFSRCSEYALYGEGQTAKSPASSAKTSQVINSSNDLVAGLDLIEDMCTVCAPEASLFLVNDGAGIEAPNGGSCNEENSRRDDPGNPSNILFNRAAPGHWLRNDVSAPDQQYYSPSDFQFLASFLNLEEWQM